MSGYTRDHRHDFLVSLRKAETMLETLGTKLSNQTYQAVDDMDLVTEGDTEKMRARLEALESLFDSWGEEPAFSWRD